MRIDVQTHFLPERYLDALSERATSVTVETRDGQPFISHEHDSFPLYPGFVDLETRIEWMDAHGIDVGLVSVSKPSPNEGPFTVAESVDLSRALNDGYAEAHDAYPDRLNGLACLPMRDPDAAVDEVDRIVDLGLAGIGLHTSVRGKPLSHPDFAPVFERIDSHGLSAFVHPTYNALSEQLTPAEWMLNPMIMFPTETTFQFSRLVFDGFLDRYDFDMVVAHLGGALPYLKGRLEVGVEIGKQRFDESETNLPDRPIDSYLQELYYDAICHNPAALRCAIDVVGADRLLFATDYPFEAEDAEGTVRDLEEAGVTDAEYDAIMGGTAARLFDV